MIDVLQASAGLPAVFSPVRIEVDRRAAAFCRHPLGIPCDAKHRLRPHDLQRVFEVGLRVGRAGLWGSDAPLTPISAMQADPRM